MARGRLEFRVLGPLEVRADDIGVPVGGPKQRALLALLLLSANRVVSRDRLVEELLPDQEPEAADRALTVQVSRLRKALDEAGGGARLTARAPGYVLRVEPGELDLDQFERAFADGRRALEEGDSEHAADLLREALSLWRGRPLADLEFEPFARLEVERLEELRLAATEERIEAELALGRQTALVPELEALVGEHPLRERLRAQLMLALYRSGRQAEALKAYRAGQALLSQELALDPSPQLRQLEQAILRQDAALELPGDGIVAVAAAAPPLTVEAPPIEAAEEPTPAVPPRRLRSGIVAVAVVVALGLGLGLGLTVMSSESGGSAQLHGDAIALVQPASGRVQAAVPLTSAPTGSAAGFGSVWVTQFGTGTVVRIDARTHTIRQTIRAGSGPAGVAVAAGDLWVANTLDDTVSRIDPATNTIVQTIPVGHEPSAIVSARGLLWVSNRADGTVSRLNPETGRVIDAVRTGAGPSGLAAVAGTLWVSNEDNGTVTRLDATNGAVVDTIHVGDSPSAIAATPDTVWVLDQLDSTLTRIDPATDAVTATVPTDGTPGGLIAADGTAWVTNASRGTLSGFDPHRLQFRQASRIGEQPGALASTPAGLWVSVTAGGAAHRGGTLRVLNTTTNVPGIDPAAGDWVYPLQLLGMTNDGLVGFDHVAGPDGTRLVADLAVSLPEAAAGGLTYTFRLRPGIHYSTGGTVIPTDVRSSFERLFDVSSPGIGFYEQIVGAAACVHHRPCDLSKGIVVDDRDLTVTFHLARPDPDFLYKLAQPYGYVLPASTPHRLLSSPLPATGPYLIASYQPKQALRFVRNPAFREWSAAGQPDGYPDRIDWDLQPTPSQAVKMVESNRADLMVGVAVGLLPNSVQHNLRLHYAGLLRTHPLMLTNFWALNTRAKPFDDVRVRQALNYALDRRAYVNLEGGAQAAAPSCQLLPPLIPGYARYCPYTRSPSRTGRWLSPDLSRARTLVARSGTRGMQVTIWDAQDDRAGREGSLVASALTSLGYRASVHVLDDQHLFGFTNNSRNRAQVIPGGWTADYPSASDFIGKLTCPNFVPGNGVSTNDSSELCSPSLDQEIAQAQALQTTDPPAAAAAWKRLDRKLTNLAIWLPTVTIKATDIISPRVGNYAYHPLWGVMLDQSWIH